MVTYAPHTRLGSVLIMRSREEQDTWRDFAACHPRWKPDDISQAEWTAQFFDGNGTRGKAICTECPVREPCLADSLTPEAQRMPSGQRLTGIRGGVGQAIRRPLLGMNHRASSSCDCLKCRRFVAVLAGNGPLNRNTAGARCGKRATYHRGCRCIACKAAAALHTRWSSCAETVAA